MKRSLSSNMKIMKFIYMVIGSLFLVLLVNEIASGAKGNQLIIYGFVVVLMIVLYLLTDNLKTIEYDNKYLYVTSHSITEQIQKKILLISLLQQWK